MCRAVLCLVALKYYTVNTEKTQKFWMCKSNLTLLIQKWLSYGIIIPLSGCWDHWHRRHAPPWPGLARWAPVSVGPVVLVELRVVVRVAVLDGDAPGQDGGHVVAHRLALGLLLPLLLHLLQLDPYRPETQLRTQSLCPLRLNRDGLTSLLDLFWLTDARMKCF